MATKRDETSGARTAPSSPASLDLGSISVIVPTFREAENIPLLLERLEAVRREHNIELEVIFVDDNSRDGSVEAVEQFGAPWARIIVRETNPGLSPAVVEGLRSATNETLVVMDADLSHPPESIPELVLALQAGQQFAIGSRYVPGGSTDDDWGFLRWLNSRIATLLARPLTRARDPMAGFFALSRRDFERADYLNPVGYKIGLELVVKCGLDNVAEIPIHFSDRRHGESKLTLKEQLKYLRHLRRLYIYKFGTWSHLVQFMAVGASGVLVNLAVLSSLVLVGVPEAFAVAFAIAVSMVTNFALNRRFTFSYARDGSIWKQFIGFVAACSAGALVNFATTLAVNEVLPGLPIQLAAMCGIAAGLVLNFLANRFLVFRKRWITAPGSESARPPPEG